jgi:hypothetical protein
MREEKILNKIDETKNQLAASISLIMRSLNSKSERLEALQRITPTPPIENLKRVYEIAIEREDFETCEAIKEFLNQKEISY